MSNRNAHAKAGDLAEVTVPAVSIRRRADGARAQYAFLTGDLLEATALRNAGVRARHCGLSVHRILIGEGLIDPAAYVEALAGALGLAFVPAPADAGLRGGPRSSPANQGWVEGRIGGVPWVVFDGTAAAPGALAALAGRLAARGLAVGLAPPAAIRDCVVAGAGPAILRHAVSGLARLDPSASARAGSWLWQAVALAMGSGLLIGLIVLAGLSPERLATVLVTLPFLAVVALRTAVLALYPGVPPVPVSGQAPPLEDRDLPVYTLLVPLFREARVLPGLIEALRRLDYPAAKLDIKLILESVDGETIAAVRRLGLRAPFDVIVVPECQPRTKPKALNYALALARGDYVCVYDAEDVPEPGQLRAALRAFAAGPAELGCVQSRLVIDNMSSGWLCRQFALEYLTLFDGILPGLERLGVPMPLGGTSNHFPIGVLQAVGGWDAWNVTEDADLGMRLARHGYRCTVIAAATFEEAPHRFGGWIKQRTRWLKGWMQTYIVHSRRPWRQLRQLGPWGWFAFHGQLGGVILSSLIYPFCVLLLGLRLMSAQSLLPAGGLFTRVLFGVALFNLLAGYGVAMAQALVCVFGRRRWRLLLQVPLLPVYWLLISLAAYRALIQLARRPFEWEKTDHGLTRRGFLLAPGDSRSGRRRPGAGKGNGASKRTRRSGR